MRKTSQKKRHAAEILTIGDELLKGSTTNTNARFIGKLLTCLGFSVQHQAACRDIPPDIQTCLEESLKRSDLVILSGGLGPTPDDLTRDAVAAYFGVPLILSSSQWQLIRKIYRRYGETVPEMVRKEAMFPKGAKPLINRAGIALGFSMEQSGKLVVVLPGVPRELEKMMEQEVLPLLKNHFQLKPRPHLIVKTVGLSEPDIMKRLGKDFFSEPFDFGIYPDAGEVAIRIYAQESQTIETLRKKAQKGLRGDIYAWEEISLAEAIGKILVRGKQSLSVAESCTGGQVASEITKCAGSSRFFFGGVVAYDNAIKEFVLGVSSKVLKNEGAVSRPAALQMAKGIRHLFQTNYAVAVTGVAGPAGGTKSKPVGRVFISLATPKTHQVWEKDFWGDRLQIQAKATKKALEYLWRSLQRFSLNF